MTLEHVTDIDECLSSPCVHGTCVNELDRYTCLCDDDYAQPNCVARTDECASNPCLNGNCTDLYRSYWCSCYEDYTGANCDVEVDDCDSNPCVNGSCIHHLGWFACSCADGFSGPLCDTRFSDNTGMDVHVVVLVMPPSVQQCKFCKFSLMFDVSRKPVMLTNVVAAASEQVSCG